MPPTATEIQPIESHMARFRRDRWSGPRETFARLGLGSELMRQYADTRRREQVGV
jgi:hypothetical protein